jgi:hypothetical protein
MFHPPEKERTTKLEWVNQHVLLSISVCSNVPEFLVTVTTGIAPAV